MTKQILKAGRQIEDGKGRVIVDNMSSHDLEVDVSPCGFSLFIHIHDKKKVKSVGKVRRVLESGEKKK